MLFITGLPLKVTAAVGRCPRRHLSLVFYGSDQFSLETVRLLHQNLSQSESDQKMIKRLDLVLSSDANLISKFGQKTGLQCYHFPYRLPNNVYDIGVVSSFGHLIPNSDIKACRLGMLNIHGSLLPRWRGAAPLNYAVLFGDRITGITIMKIKPKRFDIGDIVAQKEHSVRDRITAYELKAELAPIGAKLLWECLADVDRFVANARPQPEEGVTYAPKFDESHGLIDWSSMTARQVDRHFRAFVGFIDVFTHLSDGRRLKLYDIVDPQVVASLEVNRLSGGDHNTSPGLTYYHKKRRILCVRCADNSWSAFGSVAVKGHKRMSALQFRNGFMSKQSLDLVLGEPTWQSRSQ